MKTWKKFNNFMT